jgi:hypothetical protein
MVKSVTEERLGKNEPFHEEAMPVGTFNEIASWGVPIDR